MHEKTHKKKKWMITLQLFDICGHVDDQLGRLSRPHDEESFDHGAGLGLENWEGPTPYGPACYSSIIVAEMIFFPSQAQDFSQI